MRGLVIAAGSDINEKALLREIEASDLIICADNGLKHIIPLGIVPDIIVGDFDSFQGELPVLYRQAKLMAFPKEKNDTDTGLALEIAREQGCMEIIMMGMIGSRVDHSLANINLMVSYAMQGIGISIKGEKNDITALIAPNEYVVYPDRPYLSVVPISDNGIWISNEGFYYPISHFHMTKGSTRGISNELIEDKGKIVLHEGVALLICTED